ncbi:major ampullate spidroin 2, putative [Eimeria mitis]|uniref:Major ampullate spidroin 2, putative n=1 Tax=Eimeria mitis TaxID=44415 RepID=U6KDQ1_9EIME|nr:major ampullate spidroin 2, putative [Eimeria mitis]CDJ36084.1 major ampullate spidroin 2, putative [Eimeria mitis]
MGFSSASAAEMGLSKTEYEDAVNLEKLYFLANSHDHAGKTSAKKIGTDRFTAFEVQKLLNKFGVLLCLSVLAEDDMCACSAIILHMIVSATAAAVRETAEANLGAPRPEPPKEGDATAEGTQEGGTHLLLPANPRSLVMTLPLGLPGPPRGPAEIEETKAVAGAKALRKRTSLQPDGHSPAATYGRGPPTQELIREASPRARFPEWGALQMPQMPQQGAPMGSFIDPSQQQWRACGGLQPQQPMQQLHSLPQLQPLQQPSSSLFGIQPQQQPQQQQQPFGMGGALGRPPQMMMQQQPQPNLMLQQHQQPNPMMQMQQLQQPQQQTNPFASMRGPQQPVARPSNPFASLQGSHFGGSPFQQQQPQLQQSQLQQSQLQQPQLQQPLQQTVGMQQTYRPPGVQQQTSPFGAPVGAPSGAPLGGGSLGTPGRAPVTSTNPFASMGQPNGWAGSGGPPFTANTFNSTIWRKQQRATAAMSATVSGEQSLLHQKNRYVHSSACFDIRFYGRHMKARKLPP